MRRAVLGTVAAVIALAPASPARAAVQISPDRVVVSGNGTGAVITRSPFRMTFTDGAGRTVLGEVANTGQAPFPVAPAPSPVPLGQDALRRPALYAPLGFTVGGRVNVQAPAGQYVGNLVTGTEAGVTYSARDVVAADPEGDGVKLTVSTSDPTGRRLLVRVGPDAAGTVRVSVRVTPDDGVGAVADSFAAGSQDTFRGFGGRHNAMDQRGEDFLNYLQQENTSEGMAGSPDDRTLFPNGRTAAYYVQSQFISSAGYGFLNDRSELSRWRMGSDRPDAWQTEVAAPGLDYLVAPGGAPQAIEHLTAVTGRQRVPPAWAAGTLLDRSTRYPNDSPAAYAKAVEGDLRDIPKYQIPLTGYRIEGWKFLSDDQNRAIIARLTSMGIKALVYFRAFVGTDANVGTDDPAAYDEAIAKGYVATTAAGQPYVFATNFNAPGALIDFTDPEAVRWFQGRLKAALDLGAEGFMADFGEQTLEAMHFKDGSTGAQMHNRYPILFQRAVREAVDQYQKDHPGRQIWYFNRTGYSGAPGSAAYEDANFAGDGTTDFSRSAGLAAQAPDMLNRAVGGAFGFTTDIGGYFDIGPYVPTTKELFIRWSEWAALSPFFRLHGSVSAGTHTPQTYDDETVRIYNALSALHLRARPLILKLWAEAVKTGIPPTRPLWLAEPGDAVAAKQDEEWELGPDVLVAPVVTQGATGRDVYFPKGCWEQPETGARYAGAASHRAPAALDQLPYFFRCGTRPFAPFATGAARLPVARSCASKRAFTIHLRRRVVYARVLIDGKPARTLKGARARRAVRIDLRGLPKRTVRVRVIARTAAGRTFVDRRTYRTCRPNPRR